MAVPKDRRTAGLQGLLASTTAVPTAARRVQLTAAPRELRECMTAGQTAVPRARPTVAPRERPASTTGVPTAAPNDGRSGGGGRSTRPPRIRQGRSQPQVPSVRFNASDKLLIADPLERVTGLSVAEFAATYWANQPLLRRAAELPAPSFDDLLSLAAVDELLARRGLRTPFLRMTRNGEILAPRRFTRGGGAGAEIADQVADDLVLAELAAGATLVLQGLHRVWPPVQDFAAALSSQLGHPVQVNAYVTPPESTAFDPHYDVHDVFVLQFAGRKRWRIHQPVFPSPLRQQPWDLHKAAVAARADQPALIETILEPGDALYLPRGFVHAASALGEVSGHVTVGIHPFTRQALATEMFTTLAEDIELRRSLPMGVDLTDPEVLAGELQSTVAALHAAIDRIDPAVIARGLRGQLAAMTRPAPLSPLAQLRAAEALAADDRVRLRSGLRLTVSVDDREVSIQFADKELRMPVTLADAVRAATSGRAISADSLPGLSPGEGLMLLRRLLRKGVVVPE